MPLKTENILNIRVCPLTRFVRDVHMYRSLKACDKTTWSIVDQQTTSQNNPQMLDAEQNRSKTK